MNCQHCEWRPAWSCVLCTPTKDRKINISSGEDAFIEYEVEQKEEEVEDALT